LRPASAFLGSRAPVPRAPPLRARPDFERPQLPGSVLLGPQRRPELPFGLLLHPRRGRGLHPALPVARRPASRRALAGSPADASGVGGARLSRLLLLVRLRALVPIPLLPAAAGHRDHDQRGALLPAARLAPPVDLRGPSALDPLL